MKSQIRYIPSVPCCRGRMLMGQPCANSALDVFAGQNTWFTHRVRTAIRRACELASLTTGGEVLVPSYHCGSEIDAILRAGARIRLYSVDAAGGIDVDDLSRRIGRETKAVYVTHFFGLQRRIGDVRRLCDDRAILLIEDCALVSFNEAHGQLIGTVGDLVVHSFTKTIPVPDGGVLVVRNTELADKTWVMKRSPPYDVARRFLLMARQAAVVSLRRALPSPIVDSRSERGAQVMPESYRFSDRMTDAAISPISRRMLGRVSAAEVVAQRRRNFSALDSMLRAGIPEQPWREFLHEGACPLFYFVRTDDRKAILAKLHLRGVDAIPFWAGYHPDLRLQDFPEARGLKDGVIGLPIHQDLDAKDMAYVAQEVTQAFAERVGLP